MSKVLIIDDDRNNVFALQAVLRSRSWDTVIASSAQAGMTLLKSDNDISVILLHMMMPDMDGYEMMQKIRSEKIRSDLPVIAVTAQAMRGDRERCLEAGAAEYISKPIDVDRLINLLHVYVK